MICRSCQWPHHVSSLHLVWREHFFTSGRGMSRRCPQLFHGEHWTCKSTELSCGESRTNCLCATVLITRVFIRVFLLTSRLSRWIVDAITTKYVSSDLPSPRGSGLFLLEVWGPPRPFHLVYQCTLFVTTRDGPPI